MVNSKNMNYKKKGTPEVGELILCTVKKILPHSVFVSIDEYENKEGMVHISEIAPGRIRNLRDFVKEDKRIVCKVLDINRFGNIDLSLRRVGTGLMIKKLNELKQEEKAEKLLEYIGKEFKYDIKKMYELVGVKAIEEYGSLYNFFQAIVDEGENAVKDLNLDSKLSKSLVEIIKEKIKPIEVNVNGILTLKSFSENGLNEIKTILLNAEKGGVQISYLGAPKYKFQVNALNYKKADNILNQVLEQVQKDCKKLHCDFNFEKK